jgi:hypothetical protein
LNRIRIESDPEVRDADADRDGSSEAGAVGNHGRRCDLTTHPIHAIKSACQGLFRQENEKLVAPESVKAVPPSKLALDSA